MWINRGVLILDPRIVLLVYKVDRLDGPRALYRAVLSYQRSIFVVRLFFCQHIYLFILSSVSFGIGYNTVGPALSIEWHRMSMVGACLLDSVCAYVGSNGIFIGRSQMQRDCLFRSTLIKSSPKGHLKQVVVCVFGLMFQSITLTCQKTFRSALPRAQGRNPSSAPPVHLPPPPLPRRRQGCHRAKPGRRRRGISFPPSRRWRRGRLRRVGARR
jgi:hypothetical protein